MVLAISLNAVSFLSFFCCVRFPVCLYLSTKARAYLLGLEKQVPGWPGLRPGCAALHFRHCWPWLQFWFLVWLEFELLLEKKKIKTSSKRARERAKCLQKTTTTTTTVFVVSRPQANQQPSHPSALMCPFCFVAPNKLGNQSAKISWQIGAAIAKHRVIFGIR